MNYYTYNTFLIGFLVFIFFIVQISKPASDESILKAKASVCLYDKALKQATTYIEAHCTDKYELKKCASVAYDLAMIRHNDGEIMDKASYVSDVELASLPLKNGTYAKCQN